MRAVEYGVIRNPSTRTLSGCLQFIDTRLQELLEQYHPDAVAIEGIFYAKNVKTMMVLCHARGVVINAATRFTVPVYEYEPRRVKAAVVGFGGADKQQVQKMMKTMLSLAEEPQNDAADALAIAVTHLHNRTGIAALSGTPL